MSEALNLWLLQQAESWLDWEVTGPRTVWGEFMFQFLLVVLTEVMKRPAVTQLPDHFKADFFYYFVHLF